MPATLTKLSGGTGGEKIIVIVNSEDNLAGMQGAIDLRDPATERERMPARIARAIQVVRGSQQDQRCDPDVDELADLDLTIDEVAALAKMTARNVRAYQQRRLLPPARRKGRRLVYGWEHVARLRLIRSLHGRGLSLRVIEDLVARGVEEEDLARIGVETAPGTEQVRVPIGDLSLELVTAKDPQALADLVEAGVVHIEDGELVASSASLGVAGALLSHGVDITTICRVVLVASRAANSVAERLQREIDEIDELDEQTASLAMRLASVTFSEALLDRVAESHQPCPDNAKPETSPPPGSRDQAGTGSAVSQRRTVDLTTAPATGLDDSAPQDRLTGMVPRQT